MPTKKNNEKQMPDDHSDLKHQAFCWLVNKFSLHSFRIVFPRALSSQFMRTWSNYDLMALPLKPSLQANWQVADKGGFKARLNTVKQ